jgi:hypothetical protein
MAKQRTPDELENPRQSPQPLSDDALRELARRCVDDGVPVYELALALSRSRHQALPAVMFGGNKDAGVRLALKELEFRARHGNL